MQYFIKYVWTLADGRYLVKSNIITMYTPPELPTASKTASVNGRTTYPGTSGTPVQADDDVIEYSSP